MATPDMITLNVCVTTVVFCSGAVKYDFPFNILHISGKEIKIHTLISLQSTSITPKVFHSWVDVLTAYRWVVFIFHLCCFQWSGKWQLNISLAGRLSSLQFIWILKCVIVATVWVCNHRGMLACFFQGLTCFLLASTSRSLQILLRVVDGSMMSSTKPNKQTFGQKDECIIQYAGIGGLSTRIGRGRQMFWELWSSEKVYLWQRLGRGWQTSPRIRPLPQPGCPFLWR